MDPFELLKADHQKVADLFDRLESRSGKEKLDIFKQIKSELELHTHIEEKIFYPALEKPRETHDLTLEAYEEHAVVKSLLSELSRGRTANDEWQAKAKVLRENVEHHVEEEENELFDKADNALEDDELEALGDRMADEKARKLGRSTKPAPQKARKGILSGIASLVGLGGSSGKTATKKASKKQAAATKTSKKSQKATRAGGRNSSRKTSKASKRSAGAR
jgi:hypothetical protein